MFNLQFNFLTHSNILGQIIKTTTDCQTLNKGKNVKMVNQTEIDKNLIENTTGVR